MGELEGIVWPPPMGMKMNSAEKPTELAERAIKWWKGTMLKYAASLPASTDGDTGPAFVLAVSHGAFINALVGGLVGARHVRCEKGVKVGGHLGNTAICEIEVEGRKGVVLRYGDVAHLTVTAEETKDGASQLGIPAEESNADALVA